MSSNDFFYDTPPNYGAPPPPPRQTNWGLWGVLGIIGGSFAFIVFCCCCCLLVIYIALRTPVGVVSFWTGTLQNNSGAYEVARWTICDGSQAESYMDQMETDLAYFQGTTTTLDLGNNQVQVDGVLVRNGTPDSGWSAVLTVEGGGGLLGSCIAEIQEQ